MPTSTEILETGLRLRRYWLRNQSSECLNSTDVLAIAIILCILDAGRMTVGEEALAGDLRAAFATVEGFGHLQIDVSTSPAPRILICHSKSSHPSDFVVVCGRDLSISDIHQIPSTIGDVIVPLAFCAPALWQSRLYFLENAKEDHLDVLRKVRQLMNDDIFDPLRLFEELHKLENGHHVSSSEDHVAALEAEVESLKVRVRDLEQAGLVQHHLAATMAAARERYSR